MATVPNYSLPQETERPDPGVRRESVASPAIFDAAANQTIALGKGIEAAGTGVAAIAYHMAQRENADVIFQHEAGDKAAYLAYEADLREKRQGQFAKGATTDTVNWWKDRISKNTEGMNGEQKRVYVQRATALQLQTLDTVSKFEGHQLEVAHDESWKADKVNTINLAAVNPQLVDANITEIKRLNAYQGARKGWDGAVLQAVNADDITNLHKQTIQTLVVKDPAAAETYYKAHEQEIKGSERAEIGLFAEKATAAAVGAKAAQAVWMTDGPKGDNDASNIDKMKGRIREELKANPLARDAALHEISQIDADRDKAIRARDANRTAQVNTLLMNGVPLAQVMQSPAWAALDGTEQRKLVLHEESISAQKESRAYTATLRKEHELNTAGLDTLIRLSDPEKLVSMSRDDVINLRTTIGAENTKALLSKWDAFTKNGTVLSEGKLDNDQFNVFAVRAGLDPNSKDDTMKKRIVETRDRVERIIGSEQQSKKRPLTRIEKDGVMQKLIDDTVIQHNAILRDTPMPAVALPFEKQAGAYVVVGGQEVRLSSIPADDRAAIIKARTSAGLPVTEKSIAEMWLKKQALKKPERAEPKVTEFPILP